MIQPLNNRILVRPLPKPESRIIIPERYRDRDKEDETPIEAEVVLLGLQHRDRRGRPIPWSTAPGDRVLVVDYMGAEAFIDGTRHLVVKDKDILAVLKKHEYLITSAARPWATPGGEIRSRVLEPCRCGPYERRGPAGGVCWCGGAIP